MELKERIASLVGLGELLVDVEAATFQETLNQIKVENAWFDEKQVYNALQGITTYLTTDVLTEFASRYGIKEGKSRIGIVMAGNIPAVGFHDLLCVLLCGHTAYIKLSSSDRVLMQFIISKLGEVNPGLTKGIHVVDKLSLSQLDKVIATGSDNTARYFKAYFGSKKHLIRQSRSSVAVLTGEENTTDFERLGKDVFQYYGLGCRNVTQLVVPTDYSFQEILDTWMPFETVMSNHKYANNYCYQRSVLLVNKEPHLDTGYLLVRTNPSVASAIGTIHVVHYDKFEEVPMLLAANQDKIQCVVAKEGNIAGSVPFGTAQQPAIDDFADGVDTMEFLLND